MSRAVVTGAAGGIGAAICRRMKADGWFVVGLDLHVANDADLAFQMDLRDTDRLAHIASELAAEHQIGALVHAAALQPTGGVGELSVNDWIEMLSVNLLAIETLAHWTRASLEISGGSITVVSSVHAHATSRGVAAYATSKAALEGWVRAAALDLAPRVRVNAVAPGAIDSPKLREGLARWGSRASARRAELVERTPLSRLGVPEDVAGAVAYLTGPDSHFITGSVLVVDGGATARLATE